MDTMNPLPPTVPEWAKEAAKEILAMNYPPGDAVTNIAVIVASRAAPALERLARAEAALPLTATEIARRGSVYNCATELAGFISSLISKTVAKYGDKLIGIPQGNLLVRDDLRAIIDKHFPSNARASLAALTPTAALSPAQVPGAIPLPVNEVRK